MNLKEFAQIVGMSQTTVSRALNGHPEVSERTRARILAEARRLGYSPNTYARSLAMGHGQVIGCMIPAHGRDEIVNPIYADFLAGVGAVCAQRRFDINLSVVPDLDDPETYRGLKSKGMVGGVIVQFPRVNDPRPALLSQIGLPFVVHGRVSQCDTPYSWVDVNNRRAFERAAGFLIQLGHRDIALLNGDETLDFAHRRRDGVVAALRDSGLSPDPARMFSGDMTVAYGYSHARKLLAQDRPPTAILCAATMIAIGVQQAAQQAGLQLGRDLSVLTFDDDLSYYSNPETEPVFTAMRSPVRAHGQCIADVLLTKVTTGDDAPVSKLFEAELVVGQSTAPPARG
ncbi:LacI family DNA-binding transcriptional regulator [Paracoccus sp. (in: a-proteobacteria)]|uniref:LacI family DNA-binding transcriptional regulator n=1 Tax=Paracoccus sp. TaxID=267 RepID=UPI0026E0D047|nr:LacI family DNA-binding transcriptional regulator [Paracoccus sp. (in: a-proteobacteria)]MDO5647594.1 LacI family DNA-binding transcriptional regulator [Paracoccus sp. (in: a-proteobacteria)]